MQVLIVKARPPLPHSYMLTPSCAIPSSASIFTLSVDENKKMLWLPREVLWPVPRHDSLEDHLPQPCGPTGSTSPATGLACLGKFKYFWGLVLE